MAFKIAMVRGLADFVPAEMADQFAVGLLLKDEDADFSHDQPLRNARYSWAFETICEAVDPVSP